MKKKLRYQSPKGRHTGARALLMLLALLMLIPIVVTMLY